MSLAATDTRSSPQRHGLRHALLADAAKIRLFQTEKDVLSGVYALLLLSHGEAVPARQMRSQIEALAAKQTERAYTLHNVIEWATREALIHDRD